MFGLIRTAFGWLPDSLYFLVSAILTFFAIFVAVSLIVAVFKLVQFIVQVLGGILGKVVQLFV
jgi:hypothetical protein